MNGTPTLRNLHRTLIALTLPAMLSIAALVAGTHALASDNVEHTSALDDISTRTRTEASPEPASTQTLRLASATPASREDHRNDRPASAREIKQVQRALNRLGYPAIPATGNDTPTFRNIMCAWRETVGRTVKRGPLTLNEAKRIRKMETLPEPRRKHIVGLNVNRACQVTYLVNDTKKGKAYTKMFRVSTGKPGYTTSSGTHTIHRRINGRHNSTSYPSPVGWNMYRPAYFAYKGEAFHGNNSDSAVAWYPSSHGCVRMLQADMDWLWANGGVNTGQKVHVYGTWRS